MEDQNKEFDSSFGGQVFRAVMGTLILLVAVKMWSDPYYFYIDSDVRGRIVKVFALLVYVVWSRPFALILFAMSAMFFWALAYAIYKKPAQNAAFGLMLLTVSFLTPYLVFGDFGDKNSASPKAHSSSPVQGAEQANSEYQSMGSYNSSRLKAYGQ